MIVSDGTESVVLQGYTANTVRLAVAGSGSSGGLRGSLIAQDGDFGSLGTGTVYSNVGILTSTNPSDSTLKNTIEPLKYGLAEIDKLMPKTFYYNSDSAKTSLKYGFIAQDIEKVMPDMVRKISDNSDKLGLETDGIYVTMVKAIQELNAKLEKALKEIELLKAKP